MSLTTLLIANRGEIACRIIRSAHDAGIRCIAVYVDADANALHVDAADEALRLEGSYLNARGDEIFRPGQLVDGFYTIVSGALESRIPTEATGEEFVRILGPGDHWGERALTTEFQTQGTLTALEDSRVLVLERTDFRNLRAAFPGMDDYFRGISENIYAPSLRAPPEESPRPGDLGT